MPIRMTEIVQPLGFLADLHPLADQIAADSGETDNDSDVHGIFHIPDLAISRRLVHAKPEV